MAGGMDYQYGVGVQKQIPMAGMNTPLYGQSSWGAAAGAGAGGGIGTSPQDLISQYQTAYDQAKSANETRYNEILGGYRSRRDRALADLQGSGDQERKDIAQRVSNFAGKLNQSNVDRGLAGTSAMGATGVAATKMQNDEEGRLNERLRQQRIGLDTGLDQDTLQFMERRNDTYPDFEMLSRLSQGMGGASGGGGLTIGGGGGGAGYGKKSQYAGSRLSETELFDPTTGKWHNVSSGGVTSGDAFWQTPGGRAIAADMKKTGKSFDQYQRGGQGWNPGSAPPGTPQPQAPNLGLPQGPLSFDPNFGGMPVPQGGGGDMPFPDMASLSGGGGGGGWTPDFSNMGSWGG